MRCPLAAPFLLVLLGKVSAKPVFPNATITTAPSTPSGSPVYNIHNQTFAPGITTAYYERYPFANPYFFLYTQATDDFTSSAYSSCANTWASSFRQWTDTAAVTLGPIVPETTITTVLAPWVEIQTAYTGTYTGFLKTWTVTKSDFTSTHVPTTLTITSSAYGPLYYVDKTVTFTASESTCCGKCTRYGGEVQVFFWPPETQSQSTSTQLGASINEVQASPVSIYANTTQPQVAPSSTLVDEAGFTFISPSVYVAFRSLYAANWCSEVGGRYDATTIGFEPGELSTSLGQWMGTQPFFVPLTPGAEVVWTQATFGDRTDCGDRLDWWWQIGQNAYWKSEDALSAASSLLKEFPIPGVHATDLITVNVVTKDPCKPTLSAPAQILTLDPAWNICEAPVTAFFDPPYTLTAGNGLSAISPVATPPATIPTAKPVTPTPTTSNKPAPTTTNPEVGTDEPKPTSSIVVPAPSPTAEVSTVRIVTVDSSTLSVSLNIPVTEPVPSDPAASNPNQPDLTDTAPAGLPAATGSPAAVISFGSSVVTADPSSNFIIGSQTLTPGGAVIASGTTFALGADGSAVVINGNPQTIAIVTSPATEELIIASQTLRPGGAAITVSGTVISLPPGASNILIGTKTEDLGAFITATVTASVANIGGIVMTLGGYVIQTNTPILQPDPQGTGTGNYSNGTLTFLGGATRTIRERNIWASALTLGVGILGIFL